MIVVFTCDTTSNQFIVTPSEITVPELLYQINSETTTSELYISRWIGFAEQGNHKALMIDTAEKSYSEAYLRKYRKIYPMIGAIGKPKNYDRFIVNARAILGFNACEDLDRITCPTLIIGGNDDKTVGIEASYEMKERIAGSALYVYPGLGHAAYEEAKDFNQRVYDF